MLNSNKTDKERQVNDMNSNNHDSSRTPQHLEEMMLVVSVKSWIALGTMLVLIGAVLVWAFFGSMYQKEDVSGVLVRSGRMINIYSSEDSVVLDLSVSAGDYVEKDQVLARIDQTELVNEVNLAIAQGAQESEITILRNDLIRRSQIVTYEAGRIQDVYVRSGDYVQKGTKIASISIGARADKSLECLLFVPISQIRNIRKGMQVNVSPDFADKEEYGNMVGTVAFISEYPVTKQYLYDVLGNEELADSFYGNAACYEVTVNLVTSEDTETGYYWSTSLGPPKDIGSLALCEASIITETLRPVDVFFGEE